MASLLFAGLLATSFAHAAEDDRRVPVNMPDMMKTHMRANMRDHLLAMREIQNALADGKYDVAAEIAEQRLGMSTLESHEARHMAACMPKGMQDTGTAMHRAASRFAMTAQDATVTRDLPRALGALSGVTAQCVACHAGYRLQ
ncbi:MAG: hypothetical protein WBX11_14105 [Thiobacillaceae bacterium]